MQTIQDKRALLVESILSTINNVSNHYSLLHAQDNREVYDGMKNA